MAEEMMTKAAAVPTIANSVLFLDVDGVLNHHAVFLDRRFGPFPVDGLCVERLHRVVSETGCKLVLSSSWRGMQKLERKLDAELVFEVWERGDTAPKRIPVRHKDGSTKRLEGHRGEEIAEWLSRHPEIERFAIIDDESDMREDQMPFFVKTSFDEGMQDEHADRLIAILSLASEDPPPSTKGIAAA